MYLSKLFHFRHNYLKAASLHFQIARFSFFANCSRLFDSFILAPHVFLFNSTLCVCGRNPRLSNPVNPIQGKQMTFRHLAL